MKEVEKQALNREEEKKKGTQELKEDFNGVSKISSQLTKAISYDRSPKLFDTKEIRDRDKELVEDIQRLKAKDEELNLIRKDKPVSLTPLQAKILYALAYALGRCTEEESIRKVIEQPTSTEQIKKIIKVEDFCRFIFGEARGDQRIRFRNELKKIGETEQILFLKYNDSQGNVREEIKTSPLLRVWDEIHVKRKTKKGEIKAIPVSMEIQFGRAFFLNLNTRYSPLFPILFEVWREGRKGELWHVLLSSILSVYNNYLTAARKTEKRIREEQEKLAKSKRLTPDELQERIDKAKATAMEYELKFSSIKKKVAIDYESKKYYRHKFKKDLNEVIADFKRVRLITEAFITTERAVEKVIFCLNENYYLQNKEKDDLNFLSDSV